jgi:ATP-binding cassette subfamily B protein
LTDLDPRAWQRNVSVVFQDFNRYPLSLAENVTLGAPVAGDGPALERVARRTGLDELARRLPDGWSTVVSSRYSGGVDLSGGEWQRVALARALLAVEHGARLLVLDEPTASLDVRGEAEFYDRFLELTQGVTTLIISHRFASVRQADAICVLDGGRVVERGSHAELVGSRGAYSSLFTMQAALFETAGTGDD